MLADRYGLVAETTVPLNGLSRIANSATNELIEKIVRDIADRGLPYTHVSTDMGLLRLANIRERGRDWHPLMPTYDISFGRIEPDEAFWICCLDGHGEMKATIAVRLKLVRTNFRDAWLAGSILCDDPARGVRGHICGPLAELDRIPELEAIRGEVAIPGAMWVHEDFRGKRMSEKLFALSVLHSYRRWKPDHFVGLVELAKEHGVGFRSYGFPRSHKFFSFDVPGHTLKAQNDEICVMTMSQWEARELFIDRPDQ